MELEETHLLAGKVKLLQPKAGLRAGLDAVMLAHFAQAKPEQHILDLGCGTGAVGLCLKHRTGCTLTGIDLQPDFVAVANQNAAANGWADSCQFIAGDIRTTTLVQPDAFDHVVLNPPYNRQGAWTAAPNDKRQKAMGAVEGDASLADWVKAARRWCKPKGSINIILPAEQLPQLLAELSTGFGGVEVWPLYPRAGDPALRVVVRAIKGRTGGFTLLPPLVLHEANGAWTKEANMLLK